MITNTDAIIWQMFQDRHAISRQQIEGEPDAMVKRILEFLFNRGAGRIYDYAGKTSRMVYVDGDWLRMEEEPEF